MDDKGRFHGAIKLAADGGTPKKLLCPGVEKSSISSLKTIPVRLPMTFDPKLKIVRSRQYKLIFFNIKVN